MRTFLHSLLAASGLVVSMALLACASAPISTATSTSEAEPVAVVNPTAVLPNLTAFDRAKIAREKLGHMVAMTRRGAAPHLGFNADELDRATLGAEIPVYTLSVGKLGAYDASQSPEDLLGVETARLMLISVDGQVRSTVSMSPGPDGAWRVTEVGRANLAQALDRTATTVGAAGSASGFSMVVIPQLSIRMLAHQEGADLMLTSLDDVGGTAVKAEATMSARVALAELAVVARSTAQ